MGEGHGHIEVREVRVDAAVAPVQVLKATAWDPPGRCSSRLSNRGPSAGVAAESTGDRCAPDKRREQSRESPPPAAPTSASDPPAPATSPLAGRRHRRQHDIRDERRYTAGYGHRSRKGKRQAGGWLLSGQRRANIVHRPRRLQHLGGNKSKITSDRARYRGPRFRRCAKTAEDRVRIRGRGFPHPP